MPAAKPGERIKLCAAIIFAGLPFGGDPTFLLELVQSGVERAIADLQDVAGDLFKAQADGPAVHGLQGENLQKQKIESALEQVRRFAHRCAVAALLGYRGYDTQAPLGKQGER